MFGGNMAKMMQKAQQVQQNMQDAKKEVEALVAIGKSGNEVHITLGGNYQVQDIKISDAAMDDKEMLSDMLLVAFNDASAQIQSQSEAIMKKATGGLNLPF